MAQGGGPPLEAVRGGVGKTVFAVAVIVVAIVAFLAGLGLGNVIYGVKPPKQFLLVGTNVPFAPFENFNTSSGEFEGFDIEIARLIAQEAGRTLVIRQFADFQALLTAVGQGGVDMAASAITMSGTSGAARNATMDFSNPYYNANQGVLAQASDPFTCSGECAPSELAPLTIGVQLGTTSEAWVDDNVAPLMANPSTQIVRFTLVDTEIAALKQGALDVVVIDLGPAESFAGGTGSNLKVAGEITTNELYGFAVPNGDPDGLVAIINRVLARIIADGTYDQLIQTWFG